MDVQPISIDFESRPAPRMLILLGMQHLLALTGMWVFPTVIGTLLGLDRASTAHIVQACFFTTGLVTILQSWRFLRLPVVQGPTAVFLMSVIAIGQGQGLATAFGSMAVAGLLFAGLSALGLLGRFTRLAADPLIYSMVLVIVGVQLAGIGLRGWFGADATHPGQVDFLLAAGSALAVLLCLVLGGNGIVKKASIVIGVVVGSFAAALAGRWTPPDAATILTLGPPAVAPFGLHVSASAVAIMLVAFLHASIETTGMYSLLSRWGGRPLTVSLINRGLLTECLGCAAGALLGGLGTTSYPENVAIIRITRAGSRLITMTAGIIALALSFLPGLALLIASIPSSVLSAVSTMLFGVIAINGIQMAAEIEWDDLNIAVAAPSFILAAGALFLPEPVKQALPAWLAPLATQPMVIGSVLLILLDLLINKTVRPIQARAAARLSTTLYREETV